MTRSRIYAIWIAIAYIIKEDYNYRRDSKGDDLGVLEQASLV